MLLVKLAYKACVSNWSQDELWHPYLCFDSESTAVSLCNIMSNDTWIMDWVLFFMPVRAGIYLCRYLVGRTVKRKIDLMSCQKELGPLLFIF